MILSLFVGWPYDLHNQKGVNCWGLVSLVYAKLFDDELPDYRADNFSEISSAFTLALAKGEHGFHQVDEPNDFDVVILFGKHVTHCGLYYDGKILHANRAAQQVTFENLKAVARPFKRVEYWRKLHT